MGDAALTEAYNINAAVDALRRFRDAHLRIVVLPSLRRKLQPRGTRAK